MYKPCPANIEKRPNGITVITYWKQMELTKVEDLRIRDSHLADYKNGEWVFLVCTVDIKVNGLVMATANYRGVPSYVDNAKLREIEKDLVVEAEGLLLMQAKRYAEAAHLVNVLYGRKSTLVQGEANA